MHSYHKDNLRMPGSNKFRCSKNCTVDSNVKYQVHAIDEQIIVYISPMVLQSEGDGYSI